MICLTGLKSERCAVGVSSGSVIMKARPEALVVCVGGMSFSEVGAVSALVGVEPVDVVPFAKCTGLLVVLDGARGAMEDVAAPTTVEESENKNKTCNINKIWSIKKTWLFLLSD